MRCVLFLSVFCTACSDPVSSADPDGGDEEDGSTSPCDECEREGFTEVLGCEEPVGESRECEGWCHEDGEIVWEENPPGSGYHDPEWEHDLGEHDEVVPRRNWVHNLVHGHVVLLHDCPEPCEAELDVFRQILTRRPDALILMTPDPLLDPPRFAAISWTWVYETDDPDLDTLLCFVDQHHCHAPEAARYYPELCGS